MAYDILSNLALNPAVRYRAFSADLDIGKSSGPIPVDHSYFTAEVGFSWSFGPARR